MANPAITAAGLLEAADVVLKIAKKAQELRKMGMEAEAAALTNRAKQTLKREEARVQRAARAARKAREARTRRR